MQQKHRSAESKCCFWHYEISTHIVHSFLTDVPVTSQNTAGSSTRQKNPPNTSSQLLLLLFRLLPYSSLLHSCLFFQLFLHSSFFTFSSSASFLRCSSLKFNSSCQTTRFVFILQPLLHYEHRLLAELNFAYARLFAPKQFKTSLVLFVAFQKFASKSLHHLSVRRKHVDPPRSKPETENPPSL